MPTILKKYANGTSSTIYVTCKGREALKHISRFDPECIKATISGREYCKAGTLWVYIGRTKKDDNKPKPKPQKYSYASVIQSNYGQGWEDVVSYETNSQYLCKVPGELRKDLRAYRENQPGIYRVVNRRTKNENI